MTTVATCSNPAEAMLLKSFLEANNITAYVPDELTAQSDELLPPGLDEANPVFDVEITGVWAVIYAR